MIYSHTLYYVYQKRIKYNTTKQNDSKKNISYKKKFKMMENDIVMNKLVRSLVIKFNIFSYLS